MTTQDLVHEVLKESQKARNSDNYLMYAIYSKLGKRHGIDVDHMTVPELFLHMKEYGFPSCETIRRARQKIQATFPELCGTDAVEEMRIVREEQFRNYARGHVID